MRKTLVAVLFVAVAGTIALADRGSDDGRAAPLNRTCPVMEGEDVDPTIHVDYRGQRVWFCCEDCVEKFNAHPEEYVAKLPQFAAGAPTSAPPAAPAPAVKTEHALGALHPIAVHFPIALIMVGAFASLLPGRFFRNAAVFCVLLAAIASVPAWLLGGEAEELRGKMSDALEHRVERHESFATGAMIAILAAGALTGLSTVLPAYKPVRIVAVLAVLAAAGITGFTGYLGGEIVRPDHLKPLLSLLPF